MKKRLSFLLFILIIMSFASCSDNNKPPANTIKDIVGNTYTSIKIGTQTWMVEDLKTTKYRNGDPIPNVSDQTAWTDLSTGGYCVIENNFPSGTAHNILYNWYAATDNRNIAPVGWHIPTDAEWTTLTNFLGGESVAGGILKEKGTKHWCDPNTEATNTSGFTALPGGTRSDQLIIPGCDWGLWWTSTEKDLNTAYNRILFNSDATVSRVDNNKKFGMSIRCIRD